MPLNCESARPVRVEFGCRVKAAGFARAFLGRHRRYGILGAEYGLALDRALGPTVEVGVSGPKESEETRVLLEAAAGAVGAAKAVRWTDSGDKPRAYLCAGERCLPPLTDPARLAEAVREGGRRPGGDEAGVPGAGNGTFLREVEAGEAPPPVDPG